MRKLLKKLAFPTLLITVCAMLVLWFGAPIFAIRLYRQAELEPLIRMLTPCVLLMGFQQVISGVLAGLGKQRKALYASLSGALVTLGLNWFLSAQPSMRLLGVAIALQAGQAVTLFMSWRYMMMATSKEI